MKRVMQLLTVVALALVVTAPARAADKDGGVPLPDIIPATPGTKCVQPADVMRRQHMDFLKHHRDETMHEGIRTPQYSLKACIQCHVPVEGTTAAAGQEEHKGFFCQNCHVYAGVKIDCFECHATKPEKTAAFHPMVTPGAAAMQAAQRSNGSSAEMLNQMADDNTNKTGAAHE